MRWFGTLRILRMLHLVLCFLIVLMAFGLGQILRHVSSQRHRQRLHPPADAEHRYVAVEGKTRQQQFRTVPHAVYGV